MSITYCVNSDCPFKYCERHMANIQVKSGEYSFADFDSVCERYIRYLVSEVAE